METQTQTEQAPAASVEDRIANIFGAEPPKKQAVPQQAPVQEEPAQTEEPQAASEEQPSEEESAAPAEETFELEIDGEKFVLPKKLEKGFMQERDYTQKSQTLADQRRQIELQHNQARLQALSADFEKSMEAELHQLKMLDWALEQPMDWSKLSTEEKLNQSLQIQQWERDKQKLLSAIEGKRKEHGTKLSQEIAKLRDESLDAIKKRIPGWSDATAKEIREHARSEGYSDAELNSIIDPRHTLTLWKAQQYDKLKASAQKTVSGVKNVKTTATSNPMPQQVKEKLAFRKEVQKHAQGSLQQQKLVKDRIAKIFG